MSELTFQTVNQWTIARFRGSTLTDPHIIERANRELQQRIDTLPLRARVLINFADVEFVSSQVISLLLGANHKMAEKSGTLKLCEVNPKILQALQITGLLDQFSIARHEADVVGKAKRTKAVASSEVGWLD
jgi:anti-sigma B factor antagonist